jgi:DNA-binding MarR family transcriptional regulator
MEALVLLALADRENEQTRQLNPSIDRLAADCHIGAATVKRAIKALECRGVIRVSRRRGAASRYSILAEGAGKLRVLLAYQAHSEPPSGHAKNQAQTRPGPSSERATSGLTVSREPNEPNTEPTKRNPSSRSSLPKENATQRKERQHGEDFGRSVFLGHQASGNVDVESFADEVAIHPRLFSEAALERYRALAGPNGARHLAASPDEAPQNIP